MDRTYMRYNDRPRLNSLMLLFGSMIVIYIAQIILQLAIGYDYVGEFLALGMFNLQRGFLWTVISYAFLHGGPLHLLLNALIGYMIGRSVQQDIGERRMLQACLYGALGGALLYLVFHFWQPGANLVGASAIVMALLTLFCLLRPDEPITFLLFFVFPVTVRPRYLLIGLVIFETVFLMAELQGTTVVSSSAHLGGMGAAWLFHRFVVRRELLYGGSFGGSSVRTISPQKPKKAKGQRFRVNITNRNELKNEVDRILDKINSKGFGSLTPEEKKLLDRARDILSR